MVLQKEIMNCVDEYIKAQISTLEGQNKVIATAKDFYYNQEFPISSVPGRYYSVRTLIQERMECWKDSPWHPPFLPNDQELSKYFAEKEEPFTPREGFYFEENIYKFKIVLGVENIIGHIERNEEERIKTDVEVFKLAEKRGVPEEVSTAVCSVYNDRIETLRNTDNEKERPHYMKETESFSAKVRKRCEHNNSNYPTWRY